MSKHILYKVLDSTGPVHLNFDVQHAATAGTDLRLDGVHLGNFKHDFAHEIGINNDLKGKMLSITTVIGKISGSTHNVSAEFLLEGGNEPSKIPISDDSTDPVIEERFVIVFY